MKVKQDMDTEKVTVTYTSTQWNHQKQPCAYINKIEYCFKFAAGCNYPKCLRLGSR